MTTLLRELRQAVRLLRNQPAFAVTAVSTLALAIAANTMMFGIIRAVLLDPLPVPGPDRLVRIEQVHHAGASNVTGATFVDVRARSAAFSDIAAFRVAPATFSASRQRAEGPGAVQAGATTMTAGYFAVLAIHPIAGRAPSPQDFQAGAPAVAFISASLW